MTYFRLLLVVFCVVVSVYTIAAIANDGVNLFANTLPAIAQVGWPGQFHVDFFTYLALTGLWVAWRHKFTPAGIALGVAAALLGIIFLSIYLLRELKRNGGNVPVLLLGEHHSTSAKRE